MLAVVTIAIVSAVFDVIDFVVIVIAVDVSLVTVEADNASIVLFGAVWYVEVDNCNK